MLLSVCSVFCGSWGLVAAQRKIDGVDGLRLAKKEGGL